MSTPSATASTSASQVSIKKVDAREAAFITRLGEPLGETNWNIWRERIRRVLKGVLPYINGTIECPDKDAHPNNFEVWIFNDSYAQCLLTNNIADNQMINVTHLQTAS